MRAQCALELGLVVGEDEQVVLHSEHGVAVLEERGAGRLTSLLGLRLRDEVIQLALVLRLDGRDDASLDPLRPRSLPTTSGLPSTGLMSSVSSNPPPDCSNGRLRLFLIWPLKGNLPASLSSAFHWPPSMSVSMAAAYGVSFG